MTKPLYKSLYVLAGKREDGTYGILRNPACDTVRCFDTPAEAKTASQRACLTFEPISIDIGLLVDPKIKREGNLIDISERVKRGE